MPKQRVYTFRDPTIPATYKQKQCIAHLLSLAGNNNDNIDPFKQKGMTIKQAHEWIDGLSVPHADPAVVYVTVFKPASKSKEKSVQTQTTPKPSLASTVIGAIKRMADPQPPAAPLQRPVIEPPVVEPQIIKTVITPKKANKMLSDDLIMEICYYIENSPTPLTVKDISEKFRGDGHRIDISHINDAIFYAAKNESSPMHLDIKGYITNEPPKLIKSNFAPPRWWSLFFSTEKALVIHKSRVHVAQIEKYGSRFDDVNDEINDALNEVAKKPGGKKVARRLSILIKTGAIGEAQDKAVLTNNVQQLSASVEVLLKKVALIAGPEKPETT